MRFTCVTDKKTNWELDNYIMNPTYIDDIGLIYPVKLKEYNTFMTLANEYILLDVNKKNNLIRQIHEKAQESGSIDYGVKPVLIEQENIFDYYVATIERLYNDIDNSDSKYLNKLVKKVKNMSEEEKSILSKNNDEIGMIINTFEGKNITLNKVEHELCELVKYTSGKDVVYNRELQALEIFDDKGEVYGNINRDNYYSYRECVMLQNLMHEPRIAPNLRSQASIDREHKIRFREETSLESMIAFVSNTCKIPVLELTYYRLMADYKTEVNKLDYLSNAIFRANGVTLEGGGRIPPMNIIAPLNLNKNPYTGEAKGVSEDEIKRGEHK